jgi:hypothetical protein
VFGGMLAATTLTLIFVPVFYALIERLRERRGAKVVQPSSDRHAEIGLAPEPGPAE